MASSVFSLRMKSVRLSPVSSMNFRERYPNDWKDMVAPHPEVSTAYTSYVLSCMTEIAEELGHVEDATLFRKYSEGSKKAYQAMAETADYSLDTDRQARLVRPLAFNLLDEQQTEYARKRLIQALENYSWRLGTGFLSTPLILDVLASYDLDAAYRLLENEEMPGWLFMPKNGASTIWESWEGTQAQGGIASLNHYSKGAVCEWLFKTMCGIHIDCENHFVIAPSPVVASLMPRQATTAYMVKLNAAGTRRMPAAGLESSYHATQRQPLFCLIEG